MTEEHTKTIQQLNDTFRKTGQGGDTFTTRALLDTFNADDLLLIHQKIRAFGGFTEDNDPYQEHDFGAIDHQGQKIFWKIDYYAPDMQHGSENPADPKQTKRVLTIMLASDY